MYENIRLEKGLYNLSGKSFVEALEALDPSENYADTPIASLDAYERQLKRFDIKVSGKDCDTVEKFFKTTESAVLFPEFIRRAVKQGFDNSIIPNIVAVATKTDSNTYNGCVTNSGSTPYTSITTQGNTLPETTIYEDTTATTLGKYGRAVNCSYEAVRLQKLDVLAVMFNAIGSKLANAIVSKAITVAKTGATITTISGSSFVYADIAKLYSKFVDYNMTTILASPSLVAQILAMTQMNYCRSEKCDRITMPFGAELVKSSQMDDKNIIGLDKNFALELVTSSDIIMETDKIINRQLDCFTISINAGVKKIMSDAVQVLKISS